MLPHLDMVINFNCLLSFLFFSLFVLLNIDYTKAQLCNYRLSIKTGWLEGAGTDSTMRVILANSSSSIKIPDLKTWGNGVVPMTTSKGTVWMFSLELTRGELCRVTLISDGTGAEPRWFVEYVQVKIESPFPGSHSVFFFDQWISMDHPPYRLNATRGFPSQFCQS